MGLRIVDFGFNIEPPFRNCPTDVVFYNLVVVVVNKRRFLVEGEVGQLFGGKFCSLASEFVAGVMQFVH